MTEHKIKWFCGMCYFQYYDSYVCQVTGITYQPGGVISSSLPVVCDLCGKQIAGSTYAFIPVKGVQNDKA